ncbi:MAG TPA: hypothetical protein PLC99_14345 [Verrucomicrobiota bacterium]|nr:hypothetical protein [Verrucomicrobiota bacterium]
MNKPRVTRKPPRPEKAGSQEARRRAGVVLEVLAGSLSTTDAARALGISAPKYYMVESRALSGLVAGCEPRRKGPGASLDKALQAALKDKVRLERQVSRLTALVRAQQRAAGVVVPKSTDKDGGKKRKRRPSARALKYVKALKAPEAETRIEAAGGPG